MAAWLSTWSPLTKRIPKSTSSTGPPILPEISWNLRSTDGNSLCSLAMRGISQCVVKAVDTDSVTVSVPVARASIS